MQRLFGLDDDFGEDAILGRLEGMKENIEQVNMQFKDPVSLIFVYMSFFLKRFFIFDVIG